MGDNQGAKTLFYARLTCLFCAAILGIVLVIAVKIVPSALRIIRQTETLLQEVENIAEMVEMPDSGEVDLSMMMDALENLNTVASAVGELDIDRLNNALQQLENLDLERLDALLSALKDVDLKNLGGTIGKLDGLMEPLSRFAGIFR